MSPLRRYPRLPSLSTFSLKVLVFLLVAVPQLARPLAAQSGQSELTGEVRDPSGALVAEARITLTEIRTDQTYVSTSGTRGVYSFVNLKPGLYRLVAEASGFKRLAREGIQLRTGQRVRVDIVLTVGDIREDVVVREVLPLLNLQSSSLGQVINSSTIVDLPLNGRSFISLITLVPGVAAPPGSSFPRINGGRPRVNEYLFDGISVLQPEPGQVAFLPILDAIQEFKVETNSPASEFGSNSDLRQTPIPIFGPTSPRSQKSFLSREDSI